ncbi:unnamed protein product [Boreogadus saida]
MGQIQPTLALLHPIEVKVSARAQTTESDSEVGHEVEPGVSQPPPLGDHCTASRTRYTIGNKPPRTRPLVFGTGSRMSLPCPIRASGRRGRRVDPFQALSLSGPFPVGEDEGEDFLPLTGATG